MIWEAETGECLFYRPWRRVRMACSRLVRNSTLSADESTQHHENHGICEDGVEEVHHF